MLVERLQDFIQYLKFEKRYSSHTVSAYERDLRQFRDYLAVNFQLDDIKAVSHFHIRSWLAEYKEENNKACTINRKMASLSSFYKYLQVNGVVEKNPVKVLHSQRLPQRLPTYLKESETESLFEQERFDSGFRGQTDKLICKLLYATGMRRAEIKDLRENDIEWGLAQVRILGKGNKERLVPLSSEMLSEIRAYIQLKRFHVGETAYLFCLEDGAPLYNMYLQRVVTGNIASVTTQKKKSPHVLRHTFATQLLNNGANIQAIKDLLGHSSLAATQIYTHNNIDKLKEIHKQSHPRG